MQSCERGDEQWIRLRVYEIRNPAYMFSTGQFVAITGWKFVAKVPPETADIRRVIDLSHSSDPVTSAGNCCRDRINAVCRVENHTANLRTGAEDRIIISEQCEQECVACIGRIISDGQRGKRTAWLWSGLTRNQRAEIVCVSQNWPGNGLL